MTNSYLTRWGGFQNQQKKTICFLISPSGVLHHIVVKYGTSQYPNGTVLCCDIFVLTEEGQTCHLPHSVWSAENDDSKCTNNMFQDFVLLFKLDWPKSYHFGIMLPKQTDMSIHKECLFIEWNNKQHKHDRTSVRKKRKKNTYVFSSGPGPLDSWNSQTDSSCAICHPWIKMCKSNWKLNFHDVLR